MLTLRLLGAPSVQDGDRAIYLPSQKAQALLFYLAAEAERSFTRGQIIALLWEESSEREGRNSLSTVLTRLRQSLPRFPLRAEGDTLAWQALDDVWVDLHEFQATTEAAQTARGAAEVAADQRIGRLEQAADLYRGAFLDGFGVRDSAGYDEWLRLERERWQQRWLNALEQLVEAHAALGGWDRALSYARRAMAADPLQERFHRALMRLHYQAGDRAAALAQYRTCRDLLERELGVEPDPETIALHQAIADGTLERARRPPAVAAAPTPTPAANGRPAPAGARLSARLASARRRSFVGRSEELALFGAALAADEPPFTVLHVYGPGGVGKSTLVAEFAQLAADAGVPALLLDGRNVQPIPDGFTTALRELAGESLPERVALLIDTYEDLAPLDGWLRDSFLPQMPDRALVVLAGRNPPAAGWRVDPGWQEITRAIQLDNLSEAEAADYLQRRNIPPDQQSAVLRFTHGYPLALSLAVEVLIQRPGSDFEGAPSPDVVRVLLERFVAGVPSPDHRAALEACSQVRVTSEPLLAAMLDLADARALFEWLRDLSFISTGPRGLFLHDLAREVLAADLKWRNPSWRNDLHHRARAFYMREFERAQGAAQHLALLDLIFLHDNPFIRSLFTWNEIGGLRENTPRAADWPDLVAMVRRHEGDESARLAARWFERQPAGVTVYRNRAGEVTGFNSFVTLRPDERVWAEEDPCAAAVWRFLDSQPPLEAGQFAVISRFWMDRDAYQSVSPTQGMIFVVTIRYALTTPGLAYSFHTFTHAAQWGAQAGQVLIRRLPECDFAVGGYRCGMFYYDWRALPPQAWLTALAERETQ